MDGEVRTIRFRSREAMERYMLKKVMTSRLAQVVPELSRVRSMDALIDFYCRYIPLPYMEDIRLDRRSRRGESEQSDDPDEDRASSKA